MFANVQLQLDVMCRAIRLNNWMSCPFYLCPCINQPNSNFIIQCSINFLKVKLKCNGEKIQKSCKLKVNLRLNCLSKFNYKHVQQLKFYQIVLSLMETKWKKRKKGFYIGLMNFLDLLFDVKRVKSQTYS